MKHHDTPPRRSILNQIRLIAGSILVLGLLTYGIYAMRSWIFAELPDVQIEHRDTLESYQPIDWDALEINVAEAVAAAEAKAQAARKRHAKKLEATIQERFKEGARPFADSVTGFRSSWRLLKAIVPFTDSDGHKKFIQQRWDQHLFTSDTYEKWVTTSTEGFLHDLKAIENALAVDINQILATTLDETAQNPAAEQAIMNSVHQAVKQAQQASVQAAAGQVGTIVVGEIGAMIAVRMGVSAGILGTGAAGSKFTFGISLVVSVIVERIWNWIDNPARRLAGKVRGQGSKMAAVTRQSFSEIGSRHIQQMVQRWSEITQGLDHEHSASR